MGIFDHLTLSKGATVRMPRWVLVDKFGTPQTKDGEPHVVVACTKGEAKHQFKQFYGEKSQNRGTKGTRGKRTRKKGEGRKRLPAGLRVKLAKGI